MLAGLFKIRLLALAFVPMSIERKWTCGLVKIDQSSGVYPRMASMRVGLAWHSARVPENHELVVASISF
jgi:hypothetical protein